MITSYFAIYVIDSYVLEKWHIIKNLLNNNYYPNLVHTLNQEAVTLLHIKGNFISNRTSYVLSI